MYTHMHTHTYIFYGGHSHPNNLKNDGLINVDENTYKNSMLFSLRHLLFAKFEVWQGKKKHGKRGKVSNIEVYVY